MTLGLLSIDVMAVSGVIEVMLTDEERDNTGGIDIGREMPTHAGVGVGVVERLDESEEETVEEEDEIVEVEEVTDVVGGGVDDGVREEVREEIEVKVIDVVVKVVEVVAAVTDAAEVVAKEVTVVEGSVVVVVAGMAEMEREGIGGVGTAGGGGRGGGGNEGEPLEAVREAGRLMGKPGGRVGGKDCETGEGDGEEVEFTVGEVEVRESESPVRMDDT